MIKESSKIQSVFIIGSGPIIIGQACEFDYSGVQACKALKEIGCRVVLLNSNPATIMTDPDMADSIYIDAINWQVIEKVIEKEKPDALLPTMGGQVALNCALELDKMGILAKHNVKLIGATRQVIEKAESREQFRQAMINIGLDVPKSYITNTIKEAKESQKYIGFPVIIRPSYTLGGSGSGVAHNEDEFLEICQRGFRESATHEILIEESLLGWKEFELEVIRDKKDNCIIVCSIENLDPMGIHTGDSITVAPAQTLTDKEYQEMRDAAIKVLREIGVDTGGANVQFAVDPNTGRQVVIEMNPRVSRSSALASKATGFPIAKVAALLAVGFTLDQLKNDITGGTIPASFEPSIDYVVTKIPRFNFEKFLDHDDVLTTQMKSVGEVMAVGRSFQASLQKAINSLELGLHGVIDQKIADKSYTEVFLKQQLANPSSLRLLFIAEAFRRGYSIDEVYKISSIDPWFLYYIHEIVMIEKEIHSISIKELSSTRLFYYKQKGFSDNKIAELLMVEEAVIRQKRIELGVKPVYKRIDSCSAEFPAITPYLYSSYDYECESNPTDSNKKVIVLGSGPNRIGQGIEFDYCCVKALQGIKDVGFEAIMINCNPETVSTDYDMADRLYFEPLTLESILDIIELEKPYGVILQFGGQTPLKLAQGLHEANIRILGTSYDVIDLVEDRRRFSFLINELQIKQPKNRSVWTLPDGLSAAKEIGYPLMVRPSYVLGGSSMSVVFNDEQLSAALNVVQGISKGPILLDEYLEDAIEVDVDGICDIAGNFIIAGIMEHIEPAGVHSGDSSCVIPTVSLSNKIVETIKEDTKRIINYLKIIGLINIQFAVYKDQVYVLEVNPRASRTIPFVSKACHQPVVEIATKCLLGINLSEQDIEYQEIPGSYYCIKHAVIPFDKFPGTILKLGPEMRSTGEVMGFGRSFLSTYKKSHNSLAKLDMLNKINIFVECTKEKFDNIYNELKLLQESNICNAKVYCLPLLGKIALTQGLLVEIVDDVDKLKSLVDSQYINMIVLSQKEILSKEILRDLSKEIISSKIPYALDLRTAKIMLQSILEFSEDSDSVASINDWKHYFVGKMIDRAVC